LTLDVAEMYRESVAPDHGNLLREYDGSSAGTGVFCVPAGAGKGVPARNRAVIFGRSFSYGICRAGLAPHVNSSLTEESVSVNGPSLVQPVGCRQVMTTGAGIVLVAAGAILSFAVPATSVHGLDLRVVGVIVMLPGVIALLLSLLVWRPLSRRRRNRESALQTDTQDRDIGHPNPPSATMGLVTIALVVPACARDCDSGCSGPWRHLTT
jgi:hypothetical protein